ncbi:O-antigen ligase family protein [Gelidibacter salicanalis]|uniref:O-antigen ligase family protein n=1 Tax=Gelidibacter salicanalis TaxID=291193 RepID=A0A934NGJ4_9FLAO|nr:O-antigen ligase family protein [Gelidibacter salicanalis]MBJ7879676.1 O-antigen ligase family protein [Gelidibacter salicanalis]
MILSEKRFSQIINILITLIISTIFFRVLCTWLIIIFVVFNLIFYKRLQFSKRSLVLTLCISSPFLLELLFFWNNDVLSDGLKSAEKTVSLLLLPLFIIGNRDRIDFKKTLFAYILITVALVLFLFIRFMLISPKFFDVYLRGLELWEVGYQFANSFGMHAPILNMHLAFLTVGCFWFALDALKNKNQKKIVISLLLGCLSFFFVLFVNTRIALLNVFLGMSVIFFYEVVRKYKLRNVIVIFLAGTAILLSTLYIYVNNNPYMKTKYFDVTFAHLDKINNLDSFENPEVEVYNSFVTRLSIWNSAWDISKKNILIGVGSSDGKKKLNAYYKDTNQMFLYKYKFPVHNQYLDFALRFGVMGIAVIMLYLFTIGYMGYITRNAIITTFFLIFSISNLTDDFLILFHGIVFSGFWASIFACYYLCKDPFDKLNRDH